MKISLLTVLKFGKSPTAELLSTGKEIKGLISSEGCIIKVGVRTRVGSVVVPAKSKAKTRIDITLSYTNMQFTHVCFPAHKSR